MIPGAPRRQFEDHLAAEMEGVLQPGFKAAGMRTSVTGVFLTEKAAAVVALGILQQEHSKWQGLSTKAGDVAWIHEAVRSRRSEADATESLQAIGV